MSQPASHVLQVSVAMNTDAGRTYEQNQDAIGHLVPTEPDVLADLGQIFVLADGVSGLTGGDLASQYAVSTIISRYYEQDAGDVAERLVVAFAEANNLIYGEWFAQDQPDIMATRVAAAVIRGNDLIVGSVGNCPVFLMRDAQARRLTREPDLTDDHPVLEGGAVDDPALARQLARALGSRPSAKVDVISGRVRDGDHIVLCSEGLARVVSPQEIERTVVTHAPQHAVDILIDLANTRNGEDNVSVIVMRIADARQRTQSATATPPVEDWGSSTLEEDINALRSSRLPVRSAPDPEQSSARRRRARRHMFQQYVEDSRLPELWEQMRGNMVLTGVGLAVLLALFLFVLVLIVNIGGDDEGSQDVVVPSSLAAADRTATAGAPETATAAVTGLQTQDAILATEDAQRATSVVLTLTPPPLAGPQMVEDDWFRVQPGQPVPTFETPDVNGDPASPLEPGENYWIQAVDTESINGPWYQVVDNQGIELRWVNGPSLHRRVLLVSTTGEPLPDDQQPEDIPPLVETPVPSDAGTAAVSEPDTTPAMTPDATSGAAPGPETVAPDATLDPGDGPGSAPTPTVAVEYTAERWTPGTQVYAQVAFTLRAIPSLTSEETDEVNARETAEIVQGPMATDGHWWWRIRFDDDRIGWVAQPLISFSPPS